MICTSVLALLVVGSGGGLELDSVAGTGYAAGITSRA